MQRFFKLRRGPVALLAAVLAGLAAGGAIAHTLAPGQSSTDVESPPELTPKAGSAGISVTKADPSGGPEWGIQTSTSQTGRTCVNIGRVSNGKLGRVEAGGRFVARPAGPAQGCADLSNPDASMVGAYSEGDRTLIHGVAGANVVKVFVGSEEVALSGDRAYLAVRPGSAQVGPAVTMLMNDGSRQSYDWNGAPTTTP